MNAKRTRRPRESLTLIVALTLLLFTTPVVFLWAQGNSPWYLMYLLWLVIIGLCAWRSLAHRKDDF